MIESVFLRLNRISIDRFVPIIRNPHLAEAVLIGSAGDALDIEQMPGGNIIGGDILATCPAPEC